mmetsp:Transcript_13720/g.36346  ORF Transcript_13720/g.36346 Transcript_13720/m.36346 type:complete len:193 (-) Transcript_13720:24-602(-)
MKKPSGKQEYASGKPAAAAAAQPVEQEVQQAWKFLCNGRAAGDDFAYLDEPLPDLELQTRDLRKVMSALFPKLSTMEIKWIMDMGASEETVSQERLLRLAKLPGDKEADTKGNAFRAIAAEDGTVDLEKVRCIFEALGYQGMTPEVMNETAAKLAGQDYRIGSNVVLGRRLFNRIVDRFQHGDDLKQRDAET